MACIGKVVHIVVVKTRSTPTGVTAMATIVYNGNTIVYGSGHIGRAGISGRIVSAMGTIVKFIIIGIGIGY